MKSFSLNCFKTKTSPSEEHAYAKSNLHKTTTTAEICKPEKISNKNKNLHKATIEEFEEFDKQETLITDIKTEPEQFEDESCVNEDRTKQKLDGKKTKAQEEEIANEQLRKMEQEKLEKKKNSKNNFYVAVKKTLTPKAKEKEKQELMKMEQKQKFFDVAVNENGVRIIKQVPIPGANKDELKFKCQICSIKFQTEGQLVNHSEIHNQAKAQSETDAKRNELITSKKGQGQILHNLNQKAQKKESNGVIKGVCIGVRKITNFFGIGKNKNKGKESTEASDISESEQCELDLNDQPITVHTEDEIYTITPVDSGMEVDDFGEDEIKSEDGVEALQPLKDIDEEERAAKKNTEQKNRHNDELTFKNKAKKVYGKIKHSYNDIISSKFTKTNTHALEKKIASIEILKKNQEAARIKNLNLHRKNYEIYEYNM